MTDSIINKLFFVVLFFSVIILALLMSDLALSIYRKSTDPQITLLEPEWTCTDIKVKQIHAVMSAGKAVVPITRTKNECIQWTRTSGYQPIRRSNP